MFTLKTLTNHLNGELIGDPNLEVSHISNLEDALEGHLSFVLDKRFIEPSGQSKASAFVTFKKLSNVEHQIIVDNPRASLGKTIELFSPSFPEISSSTHQDIHPSASIGSNSQIGAFVSIGKNTTIGNNCIVHPHVVIGPDCTIGDHCILFPHVTIYHNCTIGNKVIIHANSVIGSDGFGYYPDQGLQKIPHIGTVILEDNVEIGSNSSIDRGCLGKTTIGFGTKIDNLVHVSHNTTIGNHCAIAAQVGFSGSSTLKNNIQVGGQTGFDSVIVQDNVRIAGRSGVTKNVGPNTTVSGFPAWDHQQELRKEAFIRNQFKKRRS